MDRRQVRYPSLDSRAAVSGQLVHPLYHLLLPINPVQVVPQDGQAHWLEDVGVLQDDTVGSWEEKDQVYFTRGLRTRTRRLRVCFLSSMFRFSLITRSRAGHSLFHPDFCIKNALFL